jgi:hypothetical protein
MPADFNAEDACLGSLRAGVEDDSGKNCRLNISRVVVFSEVFKLHFHEANLQASSSIVNKCQNSGKAPQILNLSSGWKLLVTLMLQPLSTS